MTRHIDIVGLVGLLVLAATVRFVWLDSESIWLDEALSLKFAVRLLEDGLPAAFEPGYWHDPHPPLYYAILGSWVERFGTSEASMRGLSALLSTLTVAATWLLCRAVAGTRAAFFCAVLIAFNPLHLYYAQEVRMYALAGLLMVLGTYHWYRFHERYSVIHAVVYVVLASAMLYTHYLTSLVVAAHFAWALADIERRPWRRDVTRLAFLAACIGLVFLPWAALQLRHVPFGMIDWMSVPSPFHLLEILLALTGTEKAAAHFFAKGSTTFLVYGWVALLVVLAGAVRAWRHGPGGRLIVAVCTVPLLLIAVSYAWRPVFSMRQSNVYAPFAALLLTFALVGADRAGHAASSRRRYLPMAGATVILSMSIAGAYGCWRTLLDIERPDWRGLARNLESQPASTPIVVHQFFELGTLQYYYRGLAPLYGLNREQLGRLGEVTDGARSVILVLAHADPDKALQSLDAAYRAGNPRRHTWMRVVQLERRD